MTTLYGIKNCDTVKKARRWLEENSIDYQFHDFRSDGLDEKTLQGWIDTLGWEKLLNKRSTSWRNLSEKSKTSLGADTIVQLFLDQPTLIKRPVLDQNGQLYTGFKETEYQQIFS